MAVSLNDVKHIDALLAAGDYEQARDQIGALYCLGLAYDLALACRLNHAASAIRRYRRLVNRAGFSALDGLARGCVEMLRLECSAASPATRVGAMRALTRLGVDDLGGLLLDALDDKSRLVRREAARSPGRLRDNKLLPVLEKALHDKDPDVRAYAARSLASLSTPEALKLLTRCLKDVRKRVRHAALLSLGRMRSHDAIRLAGESLASPFPSIRDAAVASLGLAGQREAAELLERPLIDDEPQVRAEAAKAIAAVAPDNGPFLLADALDDESLLVRAEAVRGLASLNTPDALGALEAALDDERSFIRVYAAAVLATTGSVRGASILEEVLSGRDEMLRLWAVQAMASRPSAETWDRVRLALKDDAWFVRAEAALLLERARVADAVFDLEATCDDPDPWVRIAVAQALSRLGNPSGIRALVSLLRKAPDSLRAQAAHALAVFDTEQALGAAEIALGDKNRYVRVCGAWVLGNIRTPGSLDLAKKALVSKADLVRVSAQQSVIRMAWGRRISLEEGEEEPLGEVSAEEIEFLLDSDMQDADGLNDDIEP